MHLETLKNCAMSLKERKANSNNKSTQGMDGKRGIE